MHAQYVSCIACIKQSERCFVWMKDTTGGSEMADVSKHGIEPRSENSTGSFQVVCTRSSDCCSTSVLHEICIIVPKTQSNHLLRGSSNPLTCAVEDTWGFNKLNMFSMEYSLDHSIRDSRVFEPASRCFQGRHPSLGREHIYIYIP